MKKITSEQLADKLNTNKVHVLDVRSEDKYAEQHVKHANAKCINIPKTNIFDMDELDFTLPESLTKAQEIIITCTTGNSATKCATILSEKGYDVTVLEGGITSWKKQIEKEI